MNLVIPVKLYQKLRAYVENTEFEISGFGRISKIGDNFYITDLKIFKQSVSGTETILDQKALGSFYDQLIQENQPMEEWRLWFHSHCDMEVFFSATDLTTIEDFNNETLEDNWFLSLVTNHAGDVLIRLDIYSPFRLVFDRLNLEIDYTDSLIESEVKAEITEKVTSHKFDFFKKDWQPTKKTTWQSPQDKDHRPDGYDNIIPYSDLEFDIRTKSFEVKKLPIITKKKDESE